MGRNWLVVFALVGALGLFTPAATAQGRGEGHGRGHHQDDDDQGWSREGRYETRAYRDRDDRPPGWSKGRKTGWRNCGLPPGQAKKYGCRTYVHEGRRHYYYQEDDGRIIVRRPVIQIHGSVDVVR
jgi:hypothetical protein